MQVPMLPRSLNTWPGQIVARIAGIGAGFSADAQRRIALLALAISLQSLADTFGNAVNWVGGPLAPLAHMSVLAASIGLIAAAVLSSPARAPRWLARVALGLSLIGAVMGTGQLLRAVGASFTHTVYSNDGTTLDHDAAIVALQGHDPYTATNFLTAIVTLNQSAEYSTPLRLGQFALLSWRDYPKPATLRAVAAAALVHNVSAPEFESHVSYPAFAWMPLMPFVALGLPSVIIVALIAFALFAWWALQAVDPLARPWLAILLIADLPLLNSVLSGALDVQLLLLTFLAWLWWDRPWLGTIALGLDLATKQQAWFFVLFLAVFIWRQAGWRAALVRLVGASGIFLALNLPFMLHDFHAWLAGNLAPLVDPMFPRGRGLVLLGTAGWLPLWPPAVYTTLELLALAAALGWYAWRGALRYPELGLLLAMLPLWFAWRSLPSYFYFVTVPTIALWLAWRWPARPPQPLPAAPDIVERPVIEVAS